MAPNILATTTLVFFSLGIDAQTQTAHGPAAGAPLTVAQLARVSPWPRIGSPPAEGEPSPRAGQWLQESRTFEESLDALKQSWPGDAPATPSDLRLRVREYEDLLKTTVASGGYGNLVLADCLRRLSITLLTDYLLTYPSENGVVAEILAADRVRLLDAPALWDVLSDELNLRPPAGGWHLSAKREDLEIVFRSGGSTFQDQIGRMLMGRPTVSTLAARRDVNGLLVRLIEDESAERVTLAGFAEFLGKGGRFDDIRLDDVRPFLRVMEADRTRFQFPPLGINMLRAGQLDLMLRSFQARHGKAVPFAAIIEQ